MRTRYLKPGFFKNEDLSGLPAMTRLCFQGLWLLADREGRLSDRPRRIKADLFPYDKSIDDVEPMLDELAGSGFIKRYKVGPDDLIQIVNFTKHQHVHKDEPISHLPECVDSSHDCVDSSTSSDFNFNSNSNSNFKDLGPSQKPMADYPGILVGVWNEVRSPGPKVSSLTPQRRRSFARALETHPNLDQWDTVIRWLNSQPWANAPGTGEHANWRATLDWLAKPGKFAEQLDKASMGQATVRHKVGYRPPVANHEPL